MVNGIIKSNLKTGNNVKPLCKGYLFSHPKQKLYCYWNPISQAEIDKFKIAVPNCEVSS